MNELRNFAHWFLDHGIGHLAPPDEIYDYGRLRSLVLHRTPPFQVELFTILAGPSFPLEHCHHYVDAIEVQIGSTPIPLTINGLPAVPAFIDEHIIAEIPKFTWHGITAVEKNVSFFSVQKWTPDVPMSSVALDWEGIPLNSAHRQLFRQDKGNLWDAPTIREHRNDR